MLSIDTIQGAVFDLDDTLLDNGPVNMPTQWLHARSRFAAVQAVASEQRIPELLAVTPEENVNAFKTAQTHTIYGAVWNLLYMRGLTASVTIDEADPVFPLMQAISQRKNELHDDIIKEFGVEHPGATDFVKSVASRVSGRVALATAAISSDVAIFLDKYQLTEVIPEERRITLEKVTRHKPDPECFDLAFKSLGLPDSARSSVLAFEDNPRGLQSAKASGLVVCAITTRLERNDPALLAIKPDLVADSFAEFRHLLKMPE